MDWMVLVYFILGIFLLVGGAELLVRGASHLAVSLGISPLVVGLTVVAFGTSAPELAVAIKAAFSGPGGADIAVGNVVGSNIANQLMILGVTALIAPLVVHRQLVRVEVPILIAFTGLAYILALDGSVSRLDGAILFLCAVIYTISAVVQGRKQPSGTAEEELARDTLENAPMGKRWLAIARDLAFIVAGLGLLVLGSEWLVNGAVYFAVLLKVDELIIGLTIVAVGTSLPEVATSILATIKGERDIAVGNVVGSSILNLGVVLALAAIVSPISIAIDPSALEFDFPVLIAATIALLPIFFTGYSIARWEGAVFLAYYIAYTTYLLLHTTRSGALDTFSGVMLWFVVPLTVVTLCVTTARQFKAHRAL